jgi:hypothetical protein
MKLLPPRNLAIFHSSTDLLQESQKRLPIKRCDSNDNLNNIAEYLDDRARESFFLICGAQIYQVVAHQTGEKSSNFKNHSIICEWEHIMSDSPSIWTTDQNA